MITKFKNFYLVLLLVFCSTQYSKAASFNELNIRNGIPHFIEKIQKQDTVTIAYLGGSITEQEGWRVYSQDIIKTYYPQKFIRQINATVGGTGSDFGLFRLNESVLKHNPDLLFVEFAVNDDGVPSEKILWYIESIVRRAKNHTSNPEIIFIYTFKEDFLKYLKNGQMPPSVITMEQVAAHYGITSINYIPEIYKQIKHKKLIVKDSKDKIKNKPVFSPDGVHPFVKTGHRIYAEVFNRTFKKIITVSENNKKLLPEPLSIKQIQNPTLIPFSYLHLPGKWEKVVSFSPKIERQINTFGAEIFKNTNQNASVTLYFKGTAIGFADLLGPGSTKLLVEIDDTVKDTLLRVDAWSHSWRLNYKIYDNLVDKEHTVRFTVLSNNFDKSTLIDTTKVVNKSQLNEYNWFPVALLLNGELIARLPNNKTMNKFVGNIANDRPDDSYNAIWNQITPENTTKWKFCEPRDNQWTFERSKGIYDYCKENGLKFKFHTLIWGAQYPDWVDSLKTDAELKLAVEDWIRKAGETFPQADFVDVVNEPLFGHEAPFFRRAIGGMYDLYGTGWDWVIWSFEQARKAFPNAKLLINDFDILKSTNNIKNYSRIIKLLSDRKLIDGIGCQAHWIEGVSTQRIKAGLDLLSKLNPGLPIYISELEINKADDQEQLNIMKELFPILWEHPAVHGITFWGYKHSWLGKNALLVRDGKDRPAMTWLKTYLNKFNYKQNQPQ